MKWQSLAAFLGLLILGCSAKAPLPLVKSFKTPEATFETWRQSAERLDFQTLVSCYAARTQENIRRDIERTSAEGLKEMQDETRRTTFKIEKVVYEKDRAYLRTLRKIKSEEEIEVLTMIKEGPDWKLLP